MLNPKLVSPRILLIFHSLSLENPGKLEVNPDLEAHLNQEVLQGSVIPANLEMFLRPESLVMNQRRENPARIKV